MLVRPLLRHETLAAEARKVLDVALTADLTVKRRSDLTLLRLEIDAAKRLQTLSGQVAPWSEWRDAFERVEAEISSRPLDRRSRRYGA